MSTVRPVAWLSLDSRDNNSARFWTYVIAAIEKQQPEFGAHAVSLLHLPERMALVHLRLALQRPAEARESLRLLHERSASTLANDWCTCRIYTLILMARTLDLEGSRDAAIATLTAALRMAEPLGHIRTFGDHGARLAALLTQVQPASGVSRAYIERIIAACGPVPVTESVYPPAATTRMPLSQRELEVLRHIQDGLSNREIAEALYVTVGTVKRHTNSIYSKLAVGSRTQALARARTLNIFWA